MSTAFDELEATLQKQGPMQTTERLCQVLRERKDYHGLFYALLLRKRLELGLPAVQMGSSENIPKEVQQPYEDAIRVAARTVGQLYLDAGQIAGAWPFFRMIQEPAKVAEAIDKADPEDGEECQQLIQIALHEGANPRRGFDLVIKRLGICSAITTFGQDLPFGNEVREYCVKRLVRSLYEDLQGRLIADIERREGQAPKPGPLGTGTTVRDLIAGRDWLFEDEFYHIDVSHLGAIVQFSIGLPPGEELSLALELCEYGLKLSPRFRYEGEPPFQDQYRDHLLYFKTIAGMDVEEGLAHFRCKLESSDPEETGTLPAEVLVGLLARLGRYGEAIEVFKQHLATADARQLNCPSLQELCKSAGDYQPLVEVSRQRDDLVNFAAGLMQSQLNTSPKR